MFKKILGNSHGVTLIETVAAMGISVVLAAGVMRLNQNASKGMARITAKSNLLDFKNDIRRKLSQRYAENHPDASKRGVPICVDAVSTSWGTLDLAGIDPNDPSTFVSATQPLSIDQSSIDAQIGRQIPNTGITVEDIQMTGFDNGATGSTQGRCDMLLTLNNSRDGQLGTYTMRIPISCVVDDVGTPTILTCSSADGIGDEGVGEFVEDAGGRTHMVFDTAGSDFARIGPSTSINNATGALTILTSTDNSSGAVGSRNAIDLEHNASILWGPSVNGNDSIGIYGNIEDDGTGTNKDHLHLDAQVVKIENPLDPNQTTLDVEGQINAQEIYSNAYYYSSDKNFKKEIIDLGLEGSVSDRLENLRGVTYFMRKDEFPEMGFSDKKQIGLIAQEVEEIFPELVHTSPGSGYKSVAYGNFVAVLIEAFKEQREEIKENREMLAYLQGQANMKDYEQDARIEALERENEMLRDELDELRRKIDMILYKEE